MTRAGGLSCVVRYGTAGTEPGRYGTAGTGPGRYGTAGTEPGRYGTACAVVAIGILLGGPSVRAQMPDHGSHPPLPDQQFYLQCRLNAGGEPSVVEVPLQLSSPSTAAELTQMVELPAPLAPLRLKRYLPRAALEQRVVPAEGTGTKRAMQISVDGPTQSLQRWLLADDPERNRLISFIGTWRYMCVADRKQRDELFTQFKNELTRPPRLLVSRDDGSASRTLPAEVGTVRSLDELGCKLRVRSFYPHFALSKQTAQPVNQSDKRLNPAALVEIEQAGQKEQRWVFARFPDFKMRAPDALPVRIQLDCPVQAQRPVPDFAVVTIGEDVHEIWTRHKGKSASKPIALSQPVEVVGSQYTFHLARFIPAGRLIESYRPSAGKGAVTALLIETTDASGAAAAVWLAVGKQRVLSTAKGPLLVSFGPRQVPDARGAHQREPR